MPDATNVNWPIDPVDPQLVGVCPERIERVDALCQRYVDDGRVPG